MLWNQTHKKCTKQIGSSLNSQLKSCGDHIFGLFQQSSSWVQESMPQPPLFVKLGRSQRQSVLRDCDPSLRSSCLNVWSVPLLGCSSALLAASPRSCSSVSEGGLAGCASWSCSPSESLVWRRTPCRSARASCSRSPSGTPCASAPGSYAVGPCLGSGCGAR